MNTAPSHYQVLARKWRPGRFDDLVGQPHVVRALANALESGRLHHAYLFTGTRGVGKTTLARILARCFNCATGVTSTPCGECSSCVEIAEGRHLDLIEVDAASRTRVDDTREILDNAAYAPVAGRYKIYLIDEVHMLSEKSFNALLKTLEEPPAHVKFLLATTDPQKLPVTVLSRCLQFNLKAVPAVVIAEHLAHVLSEEGVNAEPDALARLAEAAEGSLRDALSLTDQAIAYSGGHLTEMDVSEMVGLLPRSHLESLLDAVWRQDGGEMLRIFDVLETMAPDWSRLLDSLAGMVHEMAMLQVLLEGSTKESLRIDMASSWMLEAAQREAPEELQLSYHILVQGKAEIPLAPDPRIGAEMTLLRLLAFQPDKSVTSGNSSGPEKIPLLSDAAKRTEVRTETAPTVPITPAPARTETASTRPITPAHRSAQKKVSAVEPGRTEGTESTASSVPENPATRKVVQHTEFDWHSFVAAMPPGPAKELASQCTLLAQETERFDLLLFSGHQMLATLRAREQLSQALQKQIGTPLQLTFQFRDQQGLDTPAERLAASVEQQRQKAEALLRADAGLLALQELLSVRIERIQVSASSAGPL